MRLNSPHINIITKACNKASRSLIRDFGEIDKLQVSSKGPGDFVTSADKRTEKTIIDELQKAHPDYGIVTEESGIINKSNTKNRWIIDPIDGTFNFLNGVPHFAISIALKSNEEIISGLIYDPIKDEMFFAEKNKGSFLNNQRIRVSKRNNLEDCLIATSGKISDNYDFSLRKSGCAALDMAYVACGRLDGYFQKNLSIWDIAAGLIILKEAGGIVNELDINNQNNLKIIASNPYINEIFLNILSKF